MKRDNKPMSFKSEEEQDNNKEVKTEDNYDQIHQNSLNDLDSKYYVNNKIINIPLFNGLLNDSFSDKEQDKLNNDKEVKTEYDQVHQNSLNDLSNDTSSDKEQDKLKNKKDAETEDNHDHEY